MPHNDDPITNATLLVAHRLGEIHEQLRIHNNNHAILIRLAEMEHKILMTQAELSAALDKLTAQVGKVAKEQSDRFDALTSKIKELTDIINAGGDVTPEVTAALASVQSALGTLDDAIPDAP